MCEGMHNTYSFIDPKTGEPAHGGYSQVRFMPQWRVEKEERERHLVDGAKRPCLESAGTDHLSTSSSITSQQAASSLIPFSCRLQTYFCVIFFGKQSIVVDADYALKIPDALRSDGAAPLLCAGVSVYSPFMHYGVKAGDTVGVVGLGGELTGNEVVQQRDCEGYQSTVDAFTFFHRIWIDVILSLSSSMYSAVSSCNRSRPHGSEDPACDGLQSCGHVHLTLKRGGGQVTRC